MWFLYVLECMAQFWVIHSGPVIISTTGEEMTLGDICVGLEGSFIIITILIFAAYMLSKRLRAPSDIYKKEVAIKNTKIIRQPRLYLAIGICGLAMFLPTALFFLFAPESRMSDFAEEIRFPLFVVSLAICLFYAFIIVFQLMWKIDLSENEFVFRNAWGIKKVYRYDDVKENVMNRSIRYYYNSKKIIKLSHFQNWEVLSKVIKKQTKKANDQ